MKLSICSNCEESFPHKLIEKLYVTDFGHRLVCPICALKLINDIQGMTRLSFSEGSQAESNRQQALAWRARKQEVPDAE